MRQILTDCWALEIPEEWQAEKDDDTIVISDADNVSTIEITAVRKAEGDVNGAELADFSSELNELSLPRKETPVGDFDGFIYEYDEEEYFCRDWFTAFKDVCLLVSYTCLIEDKTFDDAAVDQILDGISYLPVGALDK